MQKIQRHADAARKQQVTPRAAGQMKVIAWRADADRVAWVQPLIDHQRATAPFALVDAPVAGIAEGQSLLACSSAPARVTSLTLAAVATTVCASPDPTSTPLWASRQSAVRCPSWSKEGLQNAHRDCH